MRPKKKLYRHVLNPHWGGLNKDRIPYIHDGFDMLIISLDTYYEWHYEGDYAAETGTEATPEEYKLYKQFKNKKDVMSKLSNL